MHAWILPVTFRSRSLLSRFWGLGFNKEEGVVLWLGRILNVWSNRLLDYWVLSFNALFCGVQWY